MQAGLLNKKLEFYRFSSTRNEVGEKVVSWQYSFTTKAHLFSQSGGKSVDNYEVFANQTKIFWVRKYLSFTENDRVKYDSHYYNINFIEVDDRLNCKKITCTLVNE